jgi:hypothetical protein
VLQDPNDVGFRAELEDRSRVALLEDADDCFTGRGVLLPHDVRELPLRCGKVDALRAAEARLHRLLDLRDDARALRRVAEAREHLFAAAVLRPCRNQ